jgi:hypothetical protein
MHAADLRGAHRPSQTGAYKLVRSTLSFWGGTKKSHPEQQARDALVGRPIKKGSAIVNGATLQFVKTFPVALPCCTYDRWGRPVPRWRKASSTQNGATPCRVAPLVQAPQKRVGFWNSFKLGSFCAELSVKGHFCRFVQILFTSSGCDACGGLPPSSELVSVGGVPGSGRGYD